MIKDHSARAVALLSLFLGVVPKGDQTFIWGRPRGRHRSDLLCTIKNQMGGGGGGHDVNWGARAPPGPP